MMSAVHRSNVNSVEHPYLGCDVALRFLASTHQFAGVAEQLGGPPAFERYLRQPHKQPLTTWQEYRMDSRAIIVERTNHPWEAYQQVDVRGSSDAEWSRIRWLLKKEDGAWRVDGVYSEEPDDESDAESFAQDLQDIATSAPLDERTQRRLFEEFDADGSGALDEGEIAECTRRLGVSIDRATLRKLIKEVDDDGSGKIEFEEFSSLLKMANSEWLSRWSPDAGNLAKALADSATSGTPQEVVKLVMQGMRFPNVPRPLYGAEQTVRYCSPTNRASRLSSEAFSEYLKEPWYQILGEWEELEVDDDEIDASQSTCEVECLIRRDPADSFSIVAFQMSRHNGRWLIDALQITE